MIGGGGPTTTAPANDYAGNAAYQDMRSLLADVTARERQGGKG